MTNNNQKLGTQATLVLAGFIALMVLPVQIASALIFTLMSGTSKADYVNTGFNSWTADGVNQLTKAATYVKIEGLEQCATPDNNGYFLIEESICFQDGLFTLLDQTFTTDTAKFTYGYQDQFAITFDYELEGPIAPDAFPTSLAQSVEIANYGAEREFEIVNYYNLTLGNNPVDTALIDDSGRGRQIDGEQVIPDTIIGTITSPDSSSAYEVGSAEELNIANLNNNSDPVTGNPAVAYRFSKALFSGESANFSQTVEISSTSLLDAPMYNTWEALFNRDVTNASANDDVGILETPESGTLMSFGGLAAILVSGRLTRWVKKRLQNHKA